MCEKLQEYGKTANEPYFFENDNNWFVGSEALQAVKNKLLDITCVDKGKTQIEALLTMEILKLDFAENRLEPKDYREKLNFVIRSFYKDNGFPVLDETEATILLYRLLNEYYENLERGEENGKCT